MSYQAVVRDAANTLVSNQGVGMQILILQGSASGTVVYVETQTPTTNINGLLSIEIGSGTAVFGAFDSIDWSKGPYFIKTEIDPTGGTTYTITGTSQLLSVPYALHANTADSIVGGSLTVDPTNFNGANPAVDVWAALTPPPSSTGTPITIQSASITVPGPGKIIATANVDVYCDAGCNVPGDYAGARITLTTSQLAPTTTGAYSFMFTNYRTTNSCTRTAVFDVAAAGTSTVYLRGVKTTDGVGTEVGFYRGQVTLIFIPN
ncbi:MAG: hypothetical protein AB8H47_08010 [Bacteroidia bacterium]